MPLLCHPDTGRVSRMHIDCRKLWKKHLHFTREAAPEAVGRTGRSQLRDPSDSDWRSNYTGNTKRLIKKSQIRTAISDLAFVFYTPYCRITDHTGSVASPEFGMFQFLFK